MMSKIRIVARLCLGLWVVGVQMLLSTGASAATCTVKATYTVEPQDHYFCDTDIATCTNWKEVDLDRRRPGDLGAEPIRYLKVRLYLTASSADPLVTGVTDSNGKVTLSWSQSTCPASVVARHTWQRANGASTTSQRFRITDLSGTPLRQDNTVNLTAGSADWTKTWPASGGTAKSLNTRLANIYRTLDHAMDEVTSWTTNLNNQFKATDGTEIKVMYEEANTSSVGLPDWTLKIGYAQYNSGGTLRHELGHMISYALHNRQKNLNCWDYTYDGQTVDNHFTRSCEYGFPANFEGIASFWATRSITSHDTNAWMCFCGSDATTFSQNVCSTLISTMSSDTDRVVDCDGGDDGEGYFFGVGDTWVTGTSQCVNPTPNTGSDCGVSGGWRNEINVTRLLWDLIDTNDEGADDTDLTATTLANAFEGMASGTGDHQFNENDQSGCTTSRDQYNILDITGVVAGSQTDEAATNCVGNAP